MVQGAPLSRRHSSTGNGRFAAEPSRSRRRLSLCVIMAKCRRRHGHRRRPSSCWWRVRCPVRNLGRASSGAHGPQLLRGHDQRGWCAVVTAIMARGKCPPSTWRGSTQPVTAEGRRNALAVRAIRISVGGDAASAALAIGDCDLGGGAELQKGRDGKWRIARLYPVSKRGPGAPAGGSLRALRRWSDSRGVGRSRSGVTSPSPPTVCSSSTTWRTIQVFLSLR
jgi:hypothetical protein